jgi:hypothetical protein
MYNNHNALLNVSIDLYTTLISEDSDYSTFYNDLSNKAQNLFNSKSIEIRYKMLLNTNAAESYILNLFLRHFNKLIHYKYANTETCIKMLRSIILKHQMWDYSNFSHIFIHNVANCSHYKCLISILDSIQDQPSDKPFPISFNVIGCPLSTDIDILVSVKNRSDVFKDLNYTILFQELQDLGYDIITRELDINVVYIDNGHIKESSKGGSETQNIAYYTYDQHTQVYPLLVVSPTMIDIRDKIRGTAKYMLDRLKYLIGLTEYYKQKKDKSMAYQGYYNMVSYSLQILNKILPYSDKIEWLDSIKSITMKIIQLILLTKNKYEYTKTGLAKDFANIYGSDSYSGVLWLLTRGKIGVYDNTVLPILFGEYNRIATENTHQDRQWKSLSMDKAITVNPTILTDDIFAEFIKSPLIPTSSFVKYFESICPNQKHMNDIFKIDCMNTHVLPQQILDKHAIVINQRDKQWLELLTYYKCGDNTGVIPYNGLDWVAFYYNLIRGCIVEMMVVQSLDFTSILNVAYTKVMVGLLVKEKKQGSLGIAPDLLLVIDETKEIIPVEIKCVVSKPIENTHYRRAVHLATLQLESSVSILNSTRGIIVIVYIYQNEQSLVFDAKATVINSFNF